MRLLPRRLWSQARARLRGRLPVWYSPSFRLPLTGLESRVGMEPRRADFVSFWLRDCGAIRTSDLRSPRPISFEDLDRVHGLELLESLGRPEALARIYA
ncbi:MAG TPA: histone deacetylase, partial [Anaeromyxobacteraceae bacterium]|nr:histone deacetylase [Anaeromyxobacteraceae bacterium]